MILGLGIDLCSVDRMRKELADPQRGLVAAVFGPEETAYCLAKHDPAQHLAARFAAKEACVKALAAAAGSGTFWQDIQIGKEEGGRPVLRLSGRAEAAAAALGVRTCHVSLTHTQEMAAAVVVLES